MQLFQNGWLDGCSAAGGRDAYIIITGAANGNIALWDVTSLVHENYNFDGLQHTSITLAPPPSRPLTGRGSQGGRHRKRHGEGQAVGRDKALDPLGPGFAPRAEEVEAPDEEEDPNEVPKSSLLRPVSEHDAETQPPSVRSRPLQEFTAAHQSGINCMTIARIQRAEKSASGEMVYVLISGGDDQALHMATFTLEMIHSHGKIKTNKKL